MSFINFSSSSTFSSNSLGIPTVSTFNLTKGSVFDARRLKRQSSKLKLISLILILLISCSNEEAEELERCRSTFKGIQEAYLQLGEIFPDEEDIEVKFGETYGALQNIWWYYAIQNFNDQDFIDIIKDSEFFDEELWNELEDGFVNFP